MFSGTLRISSIAVSQFLDSGFWILGSGFWVLDWVLCLRLWAGMHLLYLRRKNGEELEVVMWGYRVGHVMGMI